MRKLWNFNKGFSLTECLLAIGTLAVGMLFIAGVFPVGIHFTTIATERTIAAVVADEAFAKIRLFAGDPNNPIDFSQLDPIRLTDFNNVANIHDVEFVYPSTAAPKIDKQYYWLALCRLIEGRHWLNDPNRLVQVTVFVSRKPGPYRRYPAPPTGIGVVDMPMPVRVGVEYVDSVPPIRRNRLRIIARPFPDDASGDKTFINDGSTIVDHYSGQIYRVLERDPAVDNEIILDRDWDEPPVPFIVWVVPPPLGGGRYPCIAIYQRVIRF